MVWEWSCERRILGVCENTPRTLDRETEQWGAGRPGAVAQLRRAPTALAEHPFGSQHPCGLLTTNS